MIIWGQAGPKGYVGQQTCRNILFTEKMLFQPTLKINNKMAGAIR